MTYKLNIANSWYDYTVTPKDYILQDHEPCTMVEHIEYLMNIGKAILVQHN